MSDLTPDRASPSSPVADAQSVAADVVSRLRGLTAPGMSADLLLRLRYAGRRRLAICPSSELTQARAARSWRLLTQVAAVAAVVLGAALLGEGAYRWWSERGRAAERAEALASVPPPAPQELRPVAAVELVEPDEPAPLPRSGFLAKLDALVAQPGEVSALGWIEARNGLEQLRSEFRQRFSAEGRRAVLEATGAASGREDRIQELATVVAAQLLTELDGAGDPGAVALGLRALLASGSTRALGPHRTVVRRAAERLQEQLAAGLPDAVAASALAGVMDLAVVSAGPAAELVREHAERLATATLATEGGRRPSLLHWQTSLAHLADAGQVLRLAPAFGARASLCARARRQVLQHLHERLDVATERPEVLAAMLYGFGDQIERRAIDARLALWSPRLMLPDYLALLHYAWGQYPLREGWASFQDDLRFLSAMPAPAQLDHTAALLMTLATNFAAPGSYVLFARD